MYQIRCVQFVVSAAGSGARITGEMMPTQRPCRDLCVLCKRALDQWSAIKSAVMMHVLESDVVQRLKRLHSAMSTKFHVQQVVQVDAYLT